MRLLILVLIPILVLLSASRKVAAAELRPIQAQPVIRHGIVHSIVLSNTRSAFTATVNLGLLSTPDQDVVGAFSDNSTGRAIVLLRGERGSLTAVLRSPRGLYGYDTYVGRRRFFSDYQGSSPNGITAIDRVSYDEASDVVSLFCKWDDVTRARTARDFQAPVEDGVIKVYMRDGALVVDDNFPRGYSLPGQVVMQPWPVMQPWYRRWGFIGTGVGLVTVLMLVVRSLLLKHLRRRGDQCITCGYSLAGHMKTQGQCPECGDLFARRVAQKVDLPRASDAQP